jgi:hypothetical protein
MIPEAIVAARVATPLWRPAGVESVLGLRAYAGRRVHQAGDAARGAEVRTDRLYSVFRAMLAAVCVPDSIPMLKLGGNDEWYAD